MFCVNANMLSGNKVDIPRNSSTYIIDNNYAYLNKYRVSRHNETSRFHHPCLNLNLKRVGKLTANYRLVTVGSPLMEIINCEAKSTFTRHSFSTISQNTIRFIP